MGRYSSVKKFAGGDVTVCLQVFRKDQLADLANVCLGHLFTYQKFVDPPGGSAYVYGLAYIGSPHYGVGVCHSSPFSRLYCLSVFKHCVVS